MTLADKINAAFDIIWPVSSDVDAGGTWKRQPTYTGFVAGYKAALFDNVKLTDEQLRDEFAKSALIGILSAETGVIEEELRTPTEAASEAYRIANAMLTARRQSWTQPDSVP